MKKIILQSTLTGILLIFPAITVQGQQPVKRRGELGKPPLIAPFGHGALHRGGVSTPPMLLDVAELRMILAEIGIASKTIDHIVVITRNFIDQFDLLLIKVQREELEIKEELLKEKPDLKRIQKSITEKTRYFAEIELSQIQRDLEIKSLLTRDEYDKLKSVTMKKFRSMMSPELRKNHEWNRDETGRKGPDHAK